MLPTLQIRSRSAEYGTDSVREAHRMSNAHCLSFKTIEFNVILDGSAHPLVTCNETVSRAFPRVSVGCFRLAVDATEASQPEPSTIERSSIRLSSRARRETAQTGRGE
eukprot:scaffold105678_cov32-Tisochrysis_lutea.AAC.4